MSAMSVRTAEALRRAKRWRKPSSTVMPSRFSRRLGGAPRAEFALLAQDRRAPALEVERLPGSPYVVHAEDRGAFARGVQRRGDRRAGARRGGCPRIDRGQERLAARAHGDGHAGDRHDLAKAREELEALRRVL